MRFPRRLGHGETAGLVDHLGELRVRLVVALGAIIAGSAVAFVFHHRLIEWLNAPLPPGRQPVTLGVAEPFTTSLKVSIYAGFALALPLILWQLWSFLAPAGDRRTERALGVFVALGTLLFAGGAAFGYRVALPAAVHFLTNYDDELYNVQIRARDYFSFALLVVVGVGVVFELPIFVLALVRLQILTSDRLRRNRRIGVFVAIVLAVLLPTVDVVSLVLEVVPLLVLFELSIWLATFMERRWERAYGEDWADEADELATSEL